MASCPPSTLTPPRSSAQCSSPRSRCSCQDELVCSSLCWGPAWACGPRALRPWRGHRAGAQPGSQLRARNGQLGAGHRHRLGGCSCRRQRDWLVTQLSRDRPCPHDLSPCKPRLHTCSRHLDEGSGGSRGSALPGRIFSRVGPRGWAGRLGERRLELRGWEGCLGQAGRAGRGRGGLVGVCEGWGGRGVGRGTRHSEGQECCLQWPPLPALGPPLNSV